MAARSRSHRLPKSVWAAVDWSRPDAALAALLGVSRQAVSRQRHSRGKGPSAFVRPAERFRRWVAANARSLDGRRSEAVRARFEAETGVRRPWSVGRRWGRRCTAVAAEGDAEALEARRHRLEAADLGPGRGLGRVRLLRLHAAEACRAAARVAGERSGGRG